MDIDFVDELRRFIVIYLDDIIVFSKIDEEHLLHLGRVFEKCRRFGISLNPKKTLFGLEEGKILGHIISKEGIKIDLGRIEAIQKIDHPRNIKELQSFIRKINFLRIFIPNLAELLINITNMLKKETKIKWTIEAKHSFDQVKQALTQPPCLSALIIQNISSYSLLPLSILLQLFFYRTMKAMKNHCFLQ
jgi:hypothetical protein